jgi:hypothetical protein
MIEIVKNQNNKKIAICDRLFFRKFYTKNNLPLKTTKKEKEKLVVFGINHKFQLLRKAYYI